MSNHHGRVPAPREDRRWPDRSTATALAAKYAHVPPAPHATSVTAAQLTAEYYGRELRLRYPIHVGRWGAPTWGVSSRLDSENWHPHGRLDAGQNVRALGFENLPQGRGIVAVVAVVSPATGELLLERLPLPEVDLPEVLRGAPRAWRDWRQDPAYQWLAEKPPQRVDTPAAGV